MEQLIKAMMQLIKSETCNEPLDKSALPDLTGGFLRELYIISKAQDVAHLVGNALDKNKLLSEDAVAAAYREQVFTAVYRYERLNFSYNQVCETLEKAKIRFIPLKGAIIRDYYPEPWMRTSCDIDILVDKSNLKKASETLETCLGYKKEKASAHDVSMISPNEICLELHFDLLEDNRANSSNKILRSVWEHAVVRENFNYLHDIDDAMFYFYHIAHIAKHFENGGCGIRPILDLWLMEKSVPFWNEQSIKLLKDGNLFVFANAVRNLMEVWFSDRVHDSTTLQMQDYILRGGVYGNEENQAYMKQHRSGGKLQYILSRVFLPYEQLKYQYPVLQKHRWLTPIFEIYRWGELIFGSKSKTRKRRMNSLKNISDEQVSQIADLLDRIGL